MQTKIRKIGTGYGILIPKKTLDELDAGEGDTIVIKRIEKPVKEIRGILRDYNINLDREHEKEQQEDHDHARFFKRSKK